MRMEQAHIAARPAAKNPTPQGVTPGMAMHQALDALQKHQWAEAAKLASAVLHEIPGRPLAVLVLGVAQHRLGDASALATLARAVTLAPVDAQFRYHYAVMLAERGQPELAMEQYRACLDLSPDFGDALWNCGEMFRQLGRFGVVPG